MSGSNGITDGGSPTDSTELGQGVEVYLFDRGYCGISHVETGEVNVCMLLNDSLLKEKRATRGWPGIVELLERSNPALGRG